VYRCNILILSGIQFFNGEGKLYNNKFVFLEINF
jgi:hypothetical protein